MKQDFYYWSIWDKIFHINSTVVKSCFNNRLSVTRGVKEDDITEYKDIKKIMKKMKIPSYSRK